MATRLAVLTAVCLTLVVGVPGCASTLDGTATPAAPIPPTTAETLPALLLSPSDVAAALGGADLVVRSEVSAPWNDAAHAGDDGCLAIVGAAQRAVYAGAGWTALRGQVLREPPDAREWSHFATQAVVLFADAGAATEFLAASRRGWAGCADRELRYTQQLAPDQVWAVGPVLADADMLTASREQRSPQQWFCQRALTVHGAVAVDVEACRLDAPTSGAAEIARMIAERLPAT